MRSTILWTGREYSSLENCLVNVSDNKTDIESTIVGKYDVHLYKVDYKIQTNRQWETLSCIINARVNGVQTILEFKRTTPGHWTVNGKNVPEFENCVDIDIPLTPFTNTLPIRRLQMRIEEEKIIRVLYIDLLSQKFSAVQQKYMRQSMNNYRYENIPNDFEADIEVDEDGFVIDYPELFVRTAKTTTTDC
jgi:uncharacterized protein